MVLQHGMWVLRQIAVALSAETAGCNITVELHLSPRQIINIMPRKPDIVGLLWLLAGYLRPVGPRLAPLVGMPPAQAIRSAAGCSAHDQPMHCWSCLGLKG